MGIVRAPRPDQHRFAYRLRSSIAHPGGPAYLRADPAPPTSVSSASPWAHSSWHCTMAPPCARGASCRQSRLRASFGHSRPSRAASRFTAAPRSAACSLAREPAESRVPGKPRRPSHTRQGPHPLVHQPGLLELLQQLVKARELTRGACIRMQRHSAEVVAVDRRRRARIVSSSDAPGRLGAQPGDLRGSSA